MQLDTYALFVAFAISLPFFTTYFTWIRAGHSVKKILKFIAWSFLALYLVSLSIGSLGFWIATHAWTWSPSSILGFIGIQVFYWRRWAAGQGKRGDLLLKRWSVVNPLCQALGRLGCFFAGCCYIKGNIPLNWPLLDAGTQCTLALMLYLKKDKLPPKMLYEYYLLGTLGSRFLLEFLRGDPIRGTWAYLSFPQLLCLLLIGSLLLDSSRLKGLRYSHEI